MNQKELKELIEFLIEKDVAEFELERGDVKVKIKRGVMLSPPQYAPPEVHYVTTPTAAPTAPATAGATAVPAPVAAPPETEPDAALHIIKSPIVGTFYEAPSPGAPPFVKVGDSVSDGQVLCIIEAMKLMNEIESDAAGDIVKKYVVNAQPVEYGQPLFGIRKR